MSPSRPTQVLVVHDGLATTARIASSLSSEQLSVVTVDTGLLGGDTAMDDATLRSQCQRCDAVVFAASGRDRAAGAYELAHLGAVLTALGGSGKRLVYLSDATVIGDTGHSFGNEDSARSPVAPHPWRVEAEHRMERALDTGIHSVIVRAALLHGHGCGELLSDLAGHAERSGESVYVGDGDRETSTVHIDDLVSLIRLAVEHAPQGSTLVAASDETLSWSRIAAIVADASPRECVIASVTADQADAAGLDGATMAAASVMRDSVAFRRLKWVATSAPLDTAGHVGDGPG